MQMRCAVTGCGLLVTMTYSGGLPILNMLFLVNLAITFWLDKYLLLRAYSKPPRYDASQAKMMVALLPYGVVLHLMFTIYAFGNPWLLRSGQLSTIEADDDANDVTTFALRTITQRGLQRHTAPLFALLVVFLAFFVLYQILGARLLTILKSFGGCADTDASACGGHKGEGAWSKEAGLSGAVASPAPDQHPRYLRRPPAHPERAPVPAGSNQTVPIPAVGGSAPRPGPHGLAV